MDGSAPDSPPPEARQPRLNQPSSPNRGTLVVSRGQNLRMGKARMFFRRALDVTGSSWSHKLEQTVGGAKRVSRDRNLHAGVGAACGPQADHGGRRTAWAVSDSKRSRLVYLSMPNALVSAHANLWADLYKASNPRPTVYYTTGSRKKSVHQGLPLAQCRNPISKRHQAGSSQSRNECRYGAAG